MPTPTAPNLLAEVRAEMGRKGFTAGRLAAASDINPATLSRRLAERSPLTVPELLRICDALGVSLETLAARAEAVSAA
ncbi:helix-turn-helix domain-containing protein [Terrabacter terrigena]|uniref:Helix-turn-helix domain-containing protein n=1 Tax=Terrabacter terrigena TaxID=574718 RepID=A0ABW3MY00_9MICO